MSDATTPPRDGMADMMRLWFDMASQVTEACQTLAGATVIANLSASNITIGKAEYRRNLCASQSGKCIAAYLYSCAGPGESTTDLAWDGHGMIFEAFDGRTMMMLHNHHGQQSASRAELHESAITDEGIQVQRHRGDLDGVAG